MKFANLEARLRSALHEDGAFNDATTSRIPGFSKHACRAVLLAKAPGVFAGGPVIPPLFRALRARVAARAIVPEGRLVKKGAVLARLNGPIGPVLAGERVLLNLLTHLSGIATLTARYVRAVRGTAAKILDTRKTTPLWRDLEKHAVRCGGGESHRFSLSDAILVKDNHLQFLKGRGLDPAEVFGPEAVGRKERRGLKFVAMEAASIEEVWRAIRTRVDIVLLDNMPLARLEEAVLLIRASRDALKTPFPLIEASGGVTPEKAKRLARRGVDRISVGALTHSAPALDISLEVL